VTALFKRVAVVTVGTIQFTSLDFAFRIEKSLKPEPNTCELDIFNLTPEHCAELAELAPKTGKQAKVGIPCKLEAGYEDATSLLWLGDLRTVQTTIEGPDRRTHLESGDGEKAWQNARLHVSYGAKTAIATVVRSLVRELGLAPGNVNKIVNQLKIAGSAMFPSGITISGPASKALLDVARSADMELSVQDGAIQLLDRGKALAGQALKLNDETGLLDSPSVDNEGTLSARTLLIKDVRPGTLIELDAEFVKGNFRVERCVYSGDTAGQDWGIEIEASRY
jgi:hypothetical protein